jgi:hypothetical protein
VDDCINQYDDVSYDSDDSIKEVDTTKHDHRLENSTVKSESENVKPAKSASLQTRARDLFVNVAPKVTKTFGVQWVNLYLNFTSIRSFFIYRVIKQVFGGCARVVEKTGIAPEFVMDGINVLAGKSSTLKIQEPEKPAESSKSKKKDLMYVMKQFKDKVGRRIQNMGVPLHHPSIPPPPPPPPPPIPMINITPSPSALTDSVRYPSSLKNIMKPRQKTPTRIPKPNFSIDISSALKNPPKLRKTTVKRTPGGTPMRRHSPIKGLSSPLKNQTPQEAFKRALDIKFKSVLRQRCIEEEDGKGEESWKEVDGFEDAGFDGDWDDESQSLKMKTRYLKEKRREGDREWLEGPIRKIASAAEPK